MSAIARDLKICNYFIEEPSDKVIKTLRDF